MACVGLILSEEPSAHVKLRQGNNYSAGYMEQAPSKGHEGSPTGYEDLEPELELKLIQSQI